LRRLLIAAGFIFLVEPVDACPMFYRRSSTARLLTGNRHNAVVGSIKYQWPSE
jgi:hypothetical protein